MENYIFETTGYSYTALFKSEEEIFVIFDEFQKTCPTTEEQILQSYLRIALQERLDVEESEDSQKKEKRRRKANLLDEKPTPKYRAAQYVAKSHRQFIDSMIVQHKAFHDSLKVAFSSRFLRFICFSSYGDQKAGSTCSTPYNFGLKYTKFCYFTQQEITELLEDFNARSQLQWITPEDIEF